MEEGSRWVKKALEGQHGSVPPDKLEIVEILKSLFLFGKDSPHFKVGKEILSRSELDPTDGLFGFLVQTGVWDEDENLNLHRFGISSTFPAPVMEACSNLIKQGVAVTPEGNRKDLTQLATLTIDGQGTLDFDDAVSIEDREGGCRLWVHITDVARFLKRGSSLDEEALVRTSSIYMPDARIPMLPPELAENLCSLKKGEDRYAISIMADLDDSANVVTYEIFPSVVRVGRQLTYYHANQMVQDDSDLAGIFAVAQKLRKNRLDAGALQLNLPEMNVWLDNEEEIAVARINRESPSRLMISECMILANRLAARFFRDHGKPAVFRTQLPPREHLVGDDGGTLHQNWMQRRFLSRVVLGLEPEPHAGLGLGAYLTLTSPLRKYLDLVTQRQLRGVWGMEELYSEEELTFLAQAVKEPLSYIAVLQQERRRYWLLRYLERFVGEPQEAHVLEKRRKKIIVLLTDFMLESSLPADICEGLKPEDFITVNIDRADARSDTLTVSLV